ncbi:MAG TPA: ComEC/Rec2 family competence protein [Candidatus Babeliales bacterium]|nr:ComEC/Rec2 family competence protein [Candidatus Babeliales bacterium]
MIGICFPATISSYYYFAFSIGLALLMGFYDRSQLILIILCIAAYSVGSIRITTIRQYYSSFYSTTTEQSFDVIAQIISIDSVVHPFYKQRITLSLQEIKKEKTNNWLNSESIIQLYVRPQSTLKKLLVGDVIGINSLTFKEPKNNDFNDYLIKEGIAATLFLTELNYIPISRPKYSFNRWLFYTKQGVLDRLSNKTSPQTLQLFASIFLGNKSTAPKKLTEELKDHFNTWGVTHYLARSGLHMVIFVIIWQLLLSILPIPWIIKESIMLLLGLIYCAFSWTSVSFTRALLTFIFHKVCTLIGLHTNFLHLLTIVCFLVLLHNPMQLFFLDFQLSFGLTFALACFNHIQLHHHHHRFNYKTVAS